jgi:hypothetical protein
MTARWAFICHGFTVGGRHKNPTVAQVLYASHEQASLIGTLKVAYMHLSAGESSKLTYRHESVYTHKLAHVPYRLQLPIITTKIGDKITAMTASF